VRPYSRAMDVTTIQAYCLDKAGSWADDPWSHDHPVIKVGPGERAKIFAFLGRDTVGVKAAATREEADEWVRRFPRDASVMAYIGRWGWNDLALAGAILDEDLLEAVDESYRLVVSALPRKLRPAVRDR